MQGTEYHSFGREVSNEWGSISSVHMNTYQLTPVTDNYPARSPISQQVLRVLLFLKVPGVSQSILCCTIVMHPGNDASHTLASDNSYAPSQENGKGDLLNMRVAILEVELATTK